MKTTAKPAAKKTPAAKSTEPTVLSQELSKGIQAVTLREVLELGGYKIKLTIKRDPYDFQSVARVSVWRPADLSWQHVAGISGSCMKTPSVYKAGGLRIEDFAADRAELLRQFAAIVLS